MFGARIPGLICVLVLCGILVAGLTPFRRPLNAVTWLGNEDGLRFGRYGTVWSSGQFHAAGAPNETSCSLEIWAQPAFASASSTILTFYAPGNPMQLSVHQYHSLVILKRENHDDLRRTQIIGVADVFHPAKPVFLTVTAGPQKTSIYVDGTLARSFPLFRMGNDCAGQLLIGTSPITDDSWPGDLRGLAIYDRDLTAEEALRHFQTWTTQGRPEISENVSPARVYLFDERSGNVAHDAARSGIDLYIPKRFSLLHQKFLEPFWQEFRPRRSYFMDILVNVAGFIPLGFVFFAYWSSVRPIKHPAIATVALGLAVSLTIEVLQSYLPTRDSGTTDLITNTFGTFIGVRLWSLKIFRGLLAKIGSVTAPR
ncbi:MAG: VanZ family protein [Candidatus Acidiferrales bacterium]